MSTLFHLDGAGTASDPYIITNASELQAIQGNLTAHYKLGNDIDASETDEWDEDNGKYLGFDPIGDSNDRFTGTFNGSGHTISGLYIDRSSESNVGHFGVVDTDGTIENVGLENASVEGDENVGVLVGQNIGDVRESYATGSVNGEWYVGGLVGDNRDGGEVRESYATGSVEGDYRVGGLVGQNYGEVRESYATGSVNGAGSEVGGLVGENWNYVRESYATGSVNGDWYVGGLVGDNRDGGEVRGSYATGSVEGTRVGGLVGFNRGGSEVNQSYATGSVEGNQAGGLVGWNFGDVEDSYWDLNRSGIDQQEDGIGNEIPSKDEVKGLKTTEMQGSWAFDGTSGNMTGPGDGFDFSDTYSTVAGDYPDLQNNPRKASTPHFEEPDADEQARILADMEPDEGVKLVTSDKALQAINRNSTTRGWDYRLVIDIDASGTDQWDSGSGFEPIRTFTGTFDGNEHTISTLYIDRGSESNVGLFGETGTASSIENVMLQNATVTGGKDTGPLVGAFQGTMSRSAVVGGSVTTKASREAHLGGLVGVLYTDATIELSMTSATVDANGKDEVGGLAGDMASSGTVKRSYATGDVLNGGDTIGGLLGDANSESDIIESFAAGHVEGDSRVGGLLGREDGGSGSVNIERSYWDTDATGQDSSAGDGTGLSTGEMTGLNATVEMFGFDFDDTWRPGDDYPDFAWDSEFETSADILTGDGDTNNPYEITTVYELQAIQYNLSANYTLVNDIDAERTDEWFEDGGIPLGFDPIGEIDRNNDVEFTGYLNGSGHTISDLYINRSSENYVGLFGVVDTDVTIEKIGLENVNVEGDLYVGGLVGRNNGEVSESYAIGNVTGSGNFVGPLVGYNSGEVRESYATGSVDGSLEVGGLVGYNFGEVSESYATSNVTGSGDYVGGLIGFNYGDVSESYATGSVEGTGTDIGGLVGSNDGDVSESYATGSVDGAGNNVGGLVGNDNGDVVYSYWDTESTNQPTSAGGATGLTTAQMTGINATESENMGALDLTSTWTAVDSYPLLTWSISDLDLTLAEDSVTAGESTDATVTLTLADSTTSTATTTSDYSSGDTSVATADAGTVTAAGPGSATLTAELRGFTDTASIAVAAAPSSPSGGGSSGSASPPSLEISVTEDATVETSNARAGDVVRISPETTGSSDSLGERGSVGVDAISVELATDRDFWMVVDTFERGTTGSSGTDGQADDDDVNELRSTVSTAFETETRTLSAGYVTVTHNLEPENISNVTFEFTVQTDRLDEDGLTPESITLHRQSDGWASLPTEHLETNDTEVRFEATSPGFSSFAIGTGEPLTRVTGATLAASELIEGDIASVTATVENRGEVAAEHTVELTAAGENVATETLTLGPGETDEMTLSFEPSVGEYDLAVDGSHVDSLAVTQAAATDPLADDPAVADDDADESVTSGVGERGSLHWVLLIMLAVASTLAVMLRRKGYRWSDLSSK